MLLEIIFKNISNKFVASQEKSKNICMSSPWDSIIGRTVKDLLIPKVQGSRGALW